ncbi:efflux RND transporter periplasmic adaptor subunit [Legionella taurinensis]|uniref:Efflux RND transporter periplasmic adaptor subunit n=1 Tax=Legionella taurinensis TaxID=70611 RepID=A0A3A5L7N1_9GAMM|nr:efflux RND transporter periplasmic adaptor subunit [Legionella taurinensis]MDX1836544.1 efflux RND transporter periplasmic adaptor subunit [Legionella taurinensis]PUT42991.1 efflux transporter periplasmic adaptor subunit [Legionella taurinensis]PUT45547.1 efflux transporter periplasmic adaptor subunit [Legionella taurinensis]PUT46878.1 efflux transporter periplasmic adaptor subunit [Legionella taurinensis]PUT49314.1 efflux transporter periplasmic adaptor subunit [Legionella taurinensis]
MKKRMTIMITALVIVFGGIVAFNLFKNFMIKRFFATYEPPAVSVSSVTAVKREWRPTLPAVGNFVATNGVEVNSEASGNVVKIHFESGQYVSEGSKLIDIDDSVDQATLKFNKAQLALRQLSYQRQVDLNKKGAAPVSNVDEAKANLEQSEADVEKTEAQIRQKHITAPFAGKLGIRQVNLGQYITPGQTSIVTLQSLDPLYLQFYLPEQYYKRLYINQGIEFNVEEFEGLAFQAKITAINAKVDPNTHNVLVQATLPNCPAEALSDLKKTTLVKTSKDIDTGKTIVTCSTKDNLKNHISHFVFIPGMFASIAVEQPAISEVIVLPSTAISYSLYGHSVYLIEKGTKGEKDENGKDKLYVKRVFVTTGEQSGNFTVINSGVKAGDIVVSSGELKLQNGTRVVINNSVKLNAVSNPDTIGQ